MTLFKKKDKIECSVPINFERIYQYADGSYLPDSSQPCPDENYEIMTNKYTPHSSTRYINVVVGNNDFPQQQGNNSTKTLPELYLKREDCCACTACMAICPVKAIKMCPDEEGFLYPVVDAEKCIRCHKCLSVCPIKMKDSMK